MSVAPASRALIALAAVSKLYRLGKATVKALDGATVDIAPGEFVAIMGPSGSGKSTLMNIIACLDRPTSGHYWLDGQHVSELSPDELAVVRNQVIGVVFQHFNLMARASALENVELPLLYANQPRAQRLHRARAALIRVGLGDRMNHMASELSGGEQQRVAIARAIANQPRLLLADEPTGNLDSGTSLGIMSLLQELGEGGMTVVLITHENDIARFASRVITLRDGRIVSDRRQPAARAADGAPENAAA